MILGGIFLTRELKCSVIEDNDNDKRLGLTAKADQPDGIDQWRRRLRACIRATE